MESLVLLAIVGKKGTSIEDWRSPAIPYPPGLDGCEAPVLTECALRNCHLAWMVRKRNLSARLEALERAFDSGFLGTWAGDATPVHIRGVSQALAEAQWVEDKLKSAVQWTNERTLKPASVRQLIKGAKSGNRISHEDYPLVLHDLPFPLPEAPASSVYTLTVERPPPVDLEAGGHGRPADDAPPTYSPSADASLGELSMERGAAVLEYGRRRDSLTRAGPSATVYGERETIPTYWG
ncbi:uncharacterized protein JCM15063_001800 [Sporobolomyces koalae]|uniref:uncharacterized protein n=1 Tax=Sporobolomyces koalae TaxID=500713 RepID=UPI00317C2972